MEESEDFDLSAPPRTKLGVGVMVVLLHVAAVLALIRAFAPDFTAKAVNVVLSTFSVTVTTPPPSPPPANESKPAGASGNVGKKAVPRAVSAPEPKIAIAKEPAPRAPGTGSADTSGAGTIGNGTGAEGSGNGPGSGSGGSGTGGGAVTKVVHISGQINDARDFPLPPGGRAARTGKAVILALTVNPSGRATACRVYKSSGLPDTDRVACDLAVEKLRFRPATNAAGEPVTAMFYWQQKFFF